MPTPRTTSHKPNRRRIVAFALTTAFVLHTSVAFGAGSHDQAVRNPSMRVAQVAVGTHGADSAGEIGVVAVPASGGRALAARWQSVTGAVSQVQAGLFDPHKRWPTASSPSNLSPVAATNDQMPVSASASMPRHPWAPEQLRADLPGQPPCFYNRDNGPLVEVVYAVPVGHADQWSYMRTAIAKAMERMEAYVAISSAALQGSVTRRVKFLMWSSTCTLAVKHVILPAGTDTWTETVRALDHLGFDNFRKRQYIVFLQAREHSHPNSYCGQGANGIALIYNLCRDSDLVAEHEFAHALGAVGPAGAPHRSGDGHYTDGFDRMVGESRWGARSCATRGYDVLLDCGGDDYFNPVPRLGSWLRRNPQFNIALHPVLRGVPWQRVLAVARTPNRPVGVKAPGASMCRWASVARVTTTRGVTGLRVFGGPAYTAQIIGTPRRVGDAWTVVLEIVGKRSLTRARPTIRALTSRSPQAEAGQMTTPLTLLKGTC